MEISRTDLIEETNKLIGEMLGLRGYLLETETPVYNKTFWYQMIPPGPEPIFHIVEFKPGGASINDLFELNVILIRTTYQDYYDPPSGGRMFFRGELGGYYLEPGPSLDKQWHFVTSQALVEALEDIRDRLLRYGLKYLENPLARWEHWVGKEPLPAA